MFTFDLGEGCLMRLWEESDAEETHHVVMANQAMLAEWMPWAIDPARDGQLEFIRAGRRRYAEDGTFDAAIVCDGAIVGSVGIAGLNTLNRSAHVGYWLAADAQGRGLATRATAAVLDHAFGPLDLHRAELRAGTGNTRSQAVAERLGFTREGVAREAELIGERWIDHVVFAMLAADWAARGTS